MGLCIFLSFKKPLMIKYKIKFNYASHTVTVLTNNCENTHLKQEAFTLVHCVRGFSLLL